MEDKQSNIGNEVTREREQDHSWITCSHNKWSAWFKKKKKKRKKKYYLQRSFSPVSPNGFESVAWCLVDDPQSENQWVLEICLMLSNAFFPLLMSTWQQIRFVAYPIRIRPFWKLIYIKYCRWSDATCVSTLTCPYPHCRYGKLRVEGMSTNHAGGRWTGYPTLHRRTRTTYTQLVAKIQSDLNNNAQI